MPTIAADWRKAVALKVYRRPQADLDEQEIWLTIAIDNVAAADRLVTRIDEAEERLAEFPELGRVRPELGEGVRTWVVGSYLIVYAVEPHAVVVIRILHGAREIDDLIP